LLGNWQRQVKVRVYCIATILFIRTFTLAIGEGECIEADFCSIDTSEGEASIASSISETVVAPTYSPITSDDDMPDLQSDTLNISQAILLSQDDTLNFSQLTQSKP